MEDTDFIEKSLIDWARSFRAAAKKDKYQVLRMHLKKLELPNKPGLLLEGTILFVQTSIAYLILDGRAVNEFLVQQQYDPTGVTDAPYLVTFDIHGKGYARITMPASFDQLDFADLYGTPWDRYERVGYNQIWISRTDGRDLSPEEIKSFDTAVTDDLRFDYGEEELSFWFEPDSPPGVLSVSVQDLESDSCAHAELSALMESGAMRMTEEQSIMWDNDPHAQKRTPTQVKDAEEACFERIKEDGVTPESEELKVYDQEFQDKYTAWFAAAD